MKKCRARFGLDSQDQWCRPCRWETYYHIWYVLHFRRKKKVTRERTLKKLLHDYNYNLFFKIALRSTLQRINYLLFFLSFLVKSHVFGDLNVACSFLLSLEVFSKNLQKKTLLNVLFLSSDGRRNASESKAVSTKRPESPNRRPISRLRPTTTKSNVKAYIQMERKRTLTTWTTTAPGTPGTAENPSSPSPNKA